MVMMLLMCALIGDMPAGDRVANHRRLERFHMIGAAESLSRIPYELRRI
jgi:hypothetical protein